MSKTQRQVLDSIIDSILENQERLADLDDSTAPISVVAWHARNLLELFIWARYCQSSQERAEGFMIDFARDGHELLEVQEKLFAATTGDTLEEMKRLATNNGFDIEDSFKRIDKAAKELNIYEIFGYLNKTFSKFAHPTALAVMSPEGGHVKQLRVQFKRMGLFLASGALKAAK